MIRARLTNGTFIVGIDARNVEKLKAGQPMVIDLTDTGGHDRVVLVYGDSLAIVMAELADVVGKLPPAMPMSSQDKAKPS